MEDWDDEALDREAMQQMRDAGAAARADLMRRCRELSDNPDAMRAVHERCEEIVAFSLDGDPDDTVLE